MEITKKTIERIIIRGRLEEYKEAEAYCRANGFRIIQNNPCLNDNEHPQRVTHFELMGERIIDG